MIKYSIIMPIYNTGKKLTKSIESVINQTYSNWELIAINDGSTDNSQTILEKYAKQDSRIKIFWQENKGPGIARNNGIKKCTGEYIAFIDSDDYYDLNFLKMVNDKNKKAKQDIIYIDDIKEYSNGKKFGGYSFEKHQKISKEKLLRLQMMGVIPWGGVLKVVKSDIAKKSFYSDIQVGEELIYSIEVLKNSNKIAFASGALYHYVDNQNGQHKLGGFDPWSDVANELKKYLINHNEYNLYAKEVNSLALKALTISIYRYCRKYDSKQAKEKIKEQIKKYTANFELNNIRNEYIDKKTKIIFYLIKLKQYHLLYLASKIKAKSDEQRSG